MPRGNKTVSGSGRWSAICGLAVAWALLVAGCEKPTRSESAGSLRPLHRPASQPAATAIEVPGPTTASAEGCGRVILRPTHGRPMMLEPGDAFQVLLAPDDRVLAGSQLVLRHGRAREATYLLHRLTAQEVAEDNGARALVVQVPICAAEGVYDLELITDTQSYQAVHAVRVGNFSGPIRFVHLSNMNIGDMTAPAFDESLPGEVNLLNSAFIVATGDFQEWARVQDDQSSWLAVLEYLGRFDAPVVVVCGDHDHEPSFTRHVAGSLIGTFDCGAYHFVLLLDHGAHPIQQDAEQLAWLQDDLARHHNPSWNILVGHSDELGLLDEWRSGGGLAEFVQQNRLRMYITGGHVDWDFREFADKVREAGELIYVRTHQASGALRDKATGVSHYRVIELAGEDVDWIYPTPPGPNPRANSLPVGQLSVHYDSPNDGTQPMVRATIRSGLHRAYQNGRLWLRVAKRGTGPPVLSGAQRVRVFDEGNCWLVECAFHLPQMASVTVTAGGEPLDGKPIEVQLSGQRALHFAGRRTPSGLSYYASQENVKVVLTNRSDQPQSAWPIVRLLGGEVPFKREVRRSLPLLLAAGQTTELPLRMTVGRVWSGRHELHVYFLDDPLHRLHSFAVQVSAE